MAQSKKSKVDVIAAEKAQLAQLAERTDLTVKEFLQFVSDIDAKCTSETSGKTNTAKAEAICSMYYKMYKIEELFAENPNGPTFAQCESNGLTSDNLIPNVSPDDIVKVNVNKIAGKLCPKN